jgi:hypothetical protein
MCGRMNFRCKRESDKPKKGEAHLTVMRLDSSEHKLLGLFPGVVGVPEVAVRGGFQVLGLLQIKFTD